MASTAAQERADGSAADAFLATIAADGVATHPYLANEAAFSGPEATRNLADAVHFLCILHGRHPGLVDHAAEVTACPVSQRWLNATAPAFTAERLYVTKLAVAAGPVPSTPGSAESEAAVVGQVHALRMLARSERRGCPLGAAVALVLDWWSFRPLLDRAAARLGVETPPCRLPDAEAVAAVIAEVADDVPVRRALGFGASQILLQHRGLLDLLEARQSARRDG